MINTKIPVLFQKIHEFSTEDTRFLKVKIWLMHLNENLNGSFFNKEVVESALPTLANTPILGYIEQTSDDEDDFSDHRNVLVKKNGKYLIKYIGSAYGVIPESNNARFETRLCDDGVEREFLTCEGLIWSAKWDDPVNILNRDGAKAQSMELHEDFRGEFRDDGLFHFTEFKFYGACILGDDVKPAMINASIETGFSFDHIRKEIQSKMEQFKTLITQHSFPVDVEINCSEGGSKVGLEQLLAKYSLTVEQLKEKGTDVEHYSIEDLEVKIKAEFASAENAEFEEVNQSTEATEFAESQELTEGDEDSNHATEFALTNMQLRDELRNELRTVKVTDKWGYEYSRFYYLDNDDKQVFVEDAEQNYKIFGLNFGVQGDKVTIDFESAKRKKIAFVDFEDGEQEVDIQFGIGIQERADAQKDIAVREVKAHLDEVNSQLTALKQEIQVLREFKASKLHAERQEAEETLYSQFSTLLTEDEIASVKEVSSNFSLEELEEKLYVLVGKKNIKFSTYKEKKQTVKIPLSSKDEQKKSSKPYAHLIEKHC